ncbi:hypothetical protein K493DRAFT_375671 [Basidiobolus meristosporus CBS 931.73]|uniref:TPR-like protein n=1 Tax=Basidiobolus meristosporus CBS 931.73 TaxID=1314790 RepID=A0A1Y1Y575_9FUNG|nr:hypothetical protein K493DRAFT_375671 [Basidiobolus meristosporus CBS 931.73]|eukprot:ORX93170.1 hypothetical protein K493DRAFT_375671 [Basidiobolus meristosporus CBS 931.73]
MLINHTSKGDPLALAYFLGTVHNLAVVCVSEPTVTFIRRLKKWLKIGLHALAHMDQLQKFIKSTDELSLVEIYNIYFEQLPTLPIINKNLRFIRYYLVKLAWLLVVNQLSQSREACEDSVESLLSLIKMHLERSIMDKTTHTNLNQGNMVKVSYSLLPPDDIEVEYGVTLYLLAALYAQTPVKKIDYSLVEKCTRFLGAEFYPAYYLLGYIKYHERCYSEALEYFKQCFVAEKSLRGDAFNMAGCSAVHLSKPNMAVRYFKSSLESNIRNNHPLWNLCVIYERTGKLQVETKMLTHLIERLTSDPVHNDEHFFNGNNSQSSMSLPNVIYRLGTIYTEQRKHNEAADEYSSLINPTNGLRPTMRYSADGIMRKVTRDYVYTLLMLTPPKLDEAINMCQSILDIDPLDVPIQMYLAEAIWYKDQTADSAEKAKEIYLVVQKILDEISQLCAQESDNGSLSSDRLEEPTMKRAKLESDACTDTLDPSKYRNREDLEQLFNDNYRKSLLMQTYNNQAYMLSTLGLVEEAIEIFTKSAYLSSDFDATHGWLDYRGIELNSSTEYYKRLIAEVKGDIAKLSRKEIETLTPMFNGDKARSDEWNEIEYIDLRHLDQLILTNACEMVVNLHQRS